MAFPMLKPSLTCHYQGVLHLDLPYFHRVMLCLHSETITHVLCFHYTQIVLVSKRGHKTQRVHLLKDLVIHMKYWKEAEDSEACTNQLMDMKKIGVEIESWLVICTSLWLLVDESFWKTCGIEGLYATSCSQQQPAETLFSENICFILAVHFEVLYSLVQFSVLVFHSCYIRTLSSATSVTF